MWIQRDLWTTKSFEPSDCFPVGENDSWDEPPLKLNFVEFSWGEERKRSFTEVVNTMAGRGSVRGSRPRSPEEDSERWGAGGGWNKYPQIPPPPPPHFFNQPPPSMVTSPINLPIIHHSTNFHRSTA